MVKETKQAMYIRTVQRCSILA